MNPTPLLLPAGLHAGAIIPPVPAARPMFLDTTSAPWFEGLGHPLADTGHLLGLVAVGVAAALLGRRSWWGIPAMFGALLIFGIVLGTEGAKAPMLDTAILTTGLCFVLLVLGKVRLAFATTASAVGAFGLFHGLVDGSEMIDIEADFRYLGGYLAANALVVLCGLAIGEWIQHRRAEWFRHARHLIDRWRGPTVHA